LEHSASIEQLEGSGSTEVARASLVAKSEQPGNIGLHFRASPPILAMHGNHPSTRGYDAGWFKDWGMTALELNEKPQEKRRL
jgi:hypothetical protein